MFTGKEQQSENHQLKFC